MIDRMIAWLAPERALRRSRARMQLAATTRAYEAAKPLDRHSDWYTPGTSAQAEVGPAWGRLVARSRDLVRNNAYAARAVDVRVGSEIGTGITPRFKTGDASRDDVLQTMWERWAETSACDADGEHDIYGLQALADRTLIESGEVLIRFRTRRMADGLPVPLQLQVMEGDYLDRSRDGRQQPNTNNTVVDGVEFDPLGRRVAYWLFNEHPGSSHPSFLTRQRLESRRVRASEILHIYRKRRPGQIRGVPDLAPVINRLRDLDDYHNAVLMRAKIEACLTAFVTEPDDDNASGPLERTTDPAGQHSFSPGQINKLRPGEDVKINEPTGSGAHGEYTRSELQAIAVGVGVTYDQLTGDLRQANYSSLRAGRIEIRRQIEQLQWSILIPRLCQPIADEFVRVGAIAGLWPDGPSYAEWMPPAPELVDPKKDHDAVHNMMADGLLSWGQAVQSQGYDPEAQLSDIAHWKRRFEEEGISMTFIQSDDEAPPATPDNGED